VGQAGARGYRSAVDAQRGSCFSWLHDICDPIRGTLLDCRRVPGGRADHYKTRNHHAKRRRQPQHWYGRLTSDRGQPCGPRAIDTSGGEQWRGDGLSTGRLRDGQRIKRRDQRGPIERTGGEQWRGDGLSTGRLRDRQRLKRRDQRGPIERTVCRLVSGVLRRVSGSDDRRQIRQRSGLGAVPAIRRLWATVSCRHRSLLRALI
jgi:hypothetical protein